MSRSASGCVCDMWTCLWQVDVFVTCGRVCDMWTCLMTSGRVCDM